MNKDREEESGVSYACPVCRDRVQRLPRAPGHEKRPNIPGERDLAFLVKRDPPSMKET